ncbi:SAM--benzoic acid carboxyl methyltransferase [Listeria monocytogenes]|nr:SAM--benzoic acid carboxyl methyltransferase [Listeria monocytogenes]EAE1498759.1 SAM--benzoic acid carboxyl methyltransferase [Listeria monocytogenes]HDI3721974.1 SAM--benzoic acid carboxyl methyltransferase [Listeria monocytogenes]HDU3385673.1 SAM--benzoic acid carboxyl methyltransferase [Listeria monocytogenes]
MPPEEYDYPECFECGDSGCVEDDNLNLVCEECGHVYTQEEWDEANNKEIDDYVALIEKESPDYFK